MRIKPKALLWRLTFRNLANFKGVPRKVGRKLPVGHFTVGWKEGVAPECRGPP